MLVFPKKDRLSEVDRLLSSFPKNEVNAISFSEIEKDFSKNAQIMQILDLICILAVIVMVAAAGSSKYVQFFNRRQELGILNAIGYTKLQIMKMTLVEVTLVNLTGFILGILFGILGSLYLSRAVFIASGGIGVVFYNKAFLMALFIPLFTTLFTLVPVNRMITRLDPINMIEGVV
jgi:putative ABC transport system permease protein